MKRLLEELQPGFEASLLSANSDARPSADARERAFLAATTAMAGAAGIAALAGATKAGAAGGMATQTAGASTGIVAKVVGVVAWKSVAIGAVIGGLVVGVGVEGAHSFDHAGALVDDTSTVPGSSVSVQTPSLSAPLVSPRPLPHETTDPSAANEPPLSSSATALPIDERPASLRAADRGRVPKVEGITPVAPTPLAPPATLSEPPTSQPPGADLAAEVRAIDRARVALAARDFAGCLKEVEDYETTHPRGSLSLEAEVLRIEALSGRGDRQEALERARRFLLAHPDGPYRTRVQKVLGDSATH